MLQTFTLTANVPQVFHGVGDFFRIMEAAGPVSVYFYFRGSEVSRAEDVGAGYAEVFEEVFDKLTIVSTSTQQVQIAVRRGNRVFFDAPPTGNVQIDNAGPTLARIAASVGAVTVHTIAANANRRYLLIQNTDTSNALRVRFDGTNPTAAQGLRIPAGGYWESPVGLCPVSAVKLLAEAGTVALEGLEG